LPTPSSDRAFTFEDSAAAGFSGQHPKRDEGSPSFGLLKRDDGSPLFGQPKHDEGLTTFDLSKRDDEELPSFGLSNRGDGSPPFGLLKPAAEKAKTYSTSSANGYESASSMADKFNEVVIIIFKLKVNCKMLYFYCFTVT
jgi:hypothetical protein